MLRAGRHLVVAPLFVVFVLVLVALSPVLLLIAGAMSLVVDRRGLRPLRGTVFLLIYLVHDVVAVLAGLGLWLRLAGAGSMHGEAMQRRHYALLHWLVERLVPAARGVLGLEVVIEGSAVALEALEEARVPTVVLSRHAGPGDSFLIVDQLLARGRRPRIVLRAALQLDPMIDLLGNRLPFCWVTRRSGNSHATCARIAAISRGMTGRDALLLFPEGGNVTPRRRRSGIRALLRQGRRRQARQAADLDHLAAPRPAGTVAALQAAPGADVVFVAHTGLAGMQTSLWRRVPVDTRMAMRLFHVPAADVPRGEEEQIDWLFSWWTRLDAWIGETCLLSPRTGDERQQHGGVKPA